MCVLKLWCSVALSLFIMILFCLEMLSARKRFSDSLASFETCFLVVVWRNWKPLCYGSCLIPLSLVTLHFSNLVLEIEVLMACSWEWGSVQFWAWELLCLGTSCLEPSRTYSNQFAGQWPTIVSMLQPRDPRRKRRSLSLIFILLSCGLNVWDELSDLLQLLLLGKQGLPQQNCKTKSFVLPRAITATPFRPDHQPNMPAPGVVQELFSDSRLFLHLGPPSAFTLKSAAEWLKC